MAYSNDQQDKLYGLLPAYIRARDADEGETLRALLRVVEGQADVIEADIVQLANNAFIETCEPWVIPYVGDLVGTTPLFDESRVKGGDTLVEYFPDLDGADPARHALNPVIGLKPVIGLSNRADVAKTIYYRRRKGTLPMLEELARDVTGWSAHAVEFFELLGWTQWVRNHLRLHAVRTPDLRSVERLDRLDRAFDEICHTVDVREIGQHDGWHNIRNVGFFLWRLIAHRLEAVEARARTDVGDFAYLFSPLGNSAPLFTAERREGDESGLAGELHVPGPIRPARFWEDLRDFAADPTAGYSELYGLFDALAGFNVAPNPSVAVFVDGAFIPPDQVVCRNLEIWDQTADADIGIDVALGRLVLGPDLAPASRVEVYYHHGFPANLGGGPYRRRAWQVRRDLAELVIAVNSSGDPGTFDNLFDALDHWANQGRPDCIIRIEDSRTYRETLTIEPADGRFLAIEAADEERPHIRLENPLFIEGDHEEGSVTLSGLLIEGRIEISGSLGRLRLLHTTLVPGVSIAEDALPVLIEPSIWAASQDSNGDAINAELRVEMACSISGPIRMPAQAEGLFAFDSVIDGAGAAALASPDAENRAGPPVRLERTTLVGETRVREFILGSECIFDGLVQAERVQTGCLRFSYVPRGSHTPRRHRCQPDLAIKREIETREEAAGGPLGDAEKDQIRERISRRVRPEYSSEVYGQPAYLQLSLKSAPEIATGSEDGSEMGAYAHLKQPQREANLRLRLEEYLPFGLEAGLIYVT
jgi:hypothetical protein